MDKRQSNGRFASGNAGGPGRPRLETEREYLNCFVGAVPLADWRKIVKHAVADAKGGDPKAREWLGKYLLPPSSDSEEQGPVQYDGEYVPTFEIVDNRITAEIEQFVSHYESLKAALKELSPEHPLLK